MRRPNVVLVLTDDQGYGDLGCHGNPVLKTPNLDRFWADSVRLTNFHAWPTCSPTRAALMTGLYNNRVGVWHTIMGRSLLLQGFPTMADAFRAAGYRTGIFGKWHLGDNYPFRPQDRGFDVTVIHKGGGVGQTPDFWGNDYFDDTYFRNGRPEKFRGYCTDVWFREATKFIENCVREGVPFFCYIATNAPHSPHHVPEKYAALYWGKAPRERAKFYGMITNIDENFGKLRETLRRLGVEDDTILIFTTDNGTSVGCDLDKHGFVRDGYNAGMRGKKGWVYEGGHRVPFFIRWPRGGLKGGRDIPQLAAAIDVLPTLLDLCGIKPLPGQRFDGVSLKPLLAGEAGSWPDRAVVVDSQRVEHPEKWRNACVMTERWRLINGEELFDMRQDPGQRRDVSKRHPGVVARLREVYERWWEDISKSFERDPAIVLGTEHENPSTLTAHDWHGSCVPWNQPHILKGEECNGYWIVRVAREGVYEFELRRWPREADLPLDGALPGGRRFAFREAGIRIGEVEESAPVRPGMKGVVFRLRLKPGTYRLQTSLITADGKSIGAYYVYVKRLG